MCACSSSLLETSLQVVAPRGYLEDVGLDLTQAYVTSASQSCWVRLALTELRASLLSLSALVWFLKSASVRGIFTLHMLIGSPCCLSKEVREDPLPSNYYDQKQALVACLRWQHARGTEPAASAQSPRLPRRYIRLLQFCRQTSAAIFCRMTVNDAQRFVLFGCHVADLSDSQCFCELASLVPRS